MLGHIPLVAARVNGKVDQNLFPQGIAGIDFPRLINFDGNSRIFEPYGLNKGVQSPHTGKFKGRLETPCKQKLGTEALSPEAVF